MNLVRRVLFVAWQNPTSRKIFPVARLLDRVEGRRWEFVYIHGAQAAAETGFVPFHGFGELTAVTQSDELPPFFANRLMRKSRPDYASYMASLGLPTAGEDEIPMLARSEGLRGSDTIELFGLPTFDEIRRTYRFMFFARGVRHIDGAEARIADLRPGMPLDVRPDPTNPAEKLALRVHEVAGGFVGFVPSTLLEDLHELEHRGSKPAAIVERVNPNPAPVQLRLLCRLEATEVGGYVPFTSHRYQPLSPQATQLNIQPHELVG